MADFTFGSDPEFMLWKQGIFYSAIGIVPGTKKSRHTIDGCDFYYDNVLAECTIQPARTKEEAVASIRKSLFHYANLVRPYYIVPRASHNYDWNQLKSKEALEAGCDPEWCAYTLEVKKPDKMFFRKNNLRSGGGHIHLGSDIIRQIPRGLIFTARMLDLFLGIPSILLDHDETTAERRKLYGRAGRYRKPKYGVEYRSMGNFWLASPKLVEVVFDTCDFVLDFLKAERHLEFWEIDEARLQSDEAWNDENFNPADCHICHAFDVNVMRDAIDNSDKIKAAEFMLFIKEYMPSKLYDTVMGLVDHPEYELYKEWSLK